MAFIMGDDRPQQIVDGKKKQTRRLALPGDTFSDGRALNANGHVRWLTPHAGVIIAQSKNAPA